jgi:hypothetical protein
MVDLARIPPKVALINRDLRPDYSAGPKNHLAPRALPCGEEYLMLKGLYAALLIVTASGTFPVQAQVAGSGAADAGSRERNPRLLNENYLAPTVRPFLTLVRRKVPQQRTRSPNRAEKQPSRPKYLQQLQLKLDKRTNARFAVGRVGREGVLSHDNPSASALHSRRGTGGMSAGRRQAV